ATLFAEWSLTSRREIYQSAPDAQPQEIATNLSPWRSTVSAAFITCYRGLQVRTTGHELLARKREIA
ncbi:hypothetical protein, partial [Sphingomonas adhaesiva]|uniref:hypothetical protein n=1 Tax=Sphingomonas adhaesiva TaxID=28212 RepID=UPI0035C706B3